MGKRVSIKRIISAALAVVMAASLCIIAIPAYRAEAATKKVSVKLGDDKDIDMKVGAKVQIKVKKNGSTYGKKSCKYKVTDGKSVVSVSSSGVIKAKKSGEAEIKITDKNGDQEAYIYVEVGGGSKNSSSKSKGKVNKIWLERASITLDVGQGWTCKVYTDEEGSNGRVIWQSENVDIATVDEQGNIRAVGHGTTRVHAQKGGKDAAILVNVN